MSREACKEHRPLVETLQLLTYEAGEKGGIERGPKRNKSSTLLLSAEIEQSRRNTFAL